MDHRDITLVYVAGPYTADDPWQTEQNIRTAEVFAREVMLIEGCWPVCPHTNTRGYFVQSCSPEKAYAGTMAMLAVCHVALFLPRWERSSGSRKERVYCSEAGKPALFSVGELKAWLAERGKRGER